MERDIRRLQWVVTFDRDEVEKAFTSQVEYNKFIKSLSTLIYETTKGHRV